MHAENILGSRSTYLPARFGGHAGRVLKAGDEIEIDATPHAPIVSTPPDCRPHIASSHALRVVKGPDWPTVAATAVAGGLFRVTPRVSRMGVEIDGVLPVFPSSAPRPSSAVFPGALQVTPHGKGFLLLADGQTTGGYPHLLQVIRADRHQLGQLRPGDSLRFLMRDQTGAEDALRTKQTLLASWLPDFRL